MFTLLEPIRDLPEVNQPIKGSALTLADLKSKKIESACIVLPFVENAENEQLFEQARDFLRVLLGAKNETRVYLAVCERSHYGVYRSLEGAVAGLREHDEGIPDGALVEQNYTFDEQPLREWSFDDYTIIEMTLT